MKPLPAISAIVAWLVLGTASPAYSQSGYDPHRAFDPLFDSQSKSPYRSSNGEPGPLYWQNRADYRIDARLDVASNTIAGTVRIAYTNNSPDQLSYLWVALDQNQLRRVSRGAKLSLSPPQFNGGFAIESVELIRNGKKSKPEYIVDDTRMQVRLPVPLGAHGGKLTVVIVYSFPIPPAGLARTGLLATKNGTIYDIAQWYPRMEVYDDLAGWNVLPFLGPGEFYCEYGDFDYRVTVPANQLVVGSGQLVNASSVLTRTELQRLARARKSDSTVTVRGLDDVTRSAGERVSGQMRTWHFRMQNARDVVWASSTSFLWDAARINLPEGKSALAMAVYPVESALDTTWKRCTQYVKHSVEIFSRDWFPYPYGEATAVGGPVGGMEYPGVIFGSWKASRKGMWIVANHEFGHEWFPMIVGSNERVNAWMDEGFNTFIDISATAEFNGGEFAPKRDNEYAPKGGNPAREIVPYLLSADSQPVVTFADAIPGKYVHTLEYYKAALGLVLLREDILGKDRFDYAFRTYIRRWAYKHPSPMDFFRTMNNAAGENLDWFWKGWFIEKWNLDQAVSEVSYVQGDSAKGALVTIKNLGQLVMPVTIRIDEANGRSTMVHLPVEIWERSGDYTFQAGSTSRIISVIIDPEERLPDIDPANNRWSSSR